MLKFFEEHGNVERWWYEPFAFKFPKGSAKRIYLPDFVVLNDEGKYSIIEVKGHMTERGALNLELMAKHYPLLPVTVIDGPAYRGIMEKMRGHVPNLEALN